jgi:serine/threonine-protein kinase
MTENTRNARSYYLRGNDRYGRGDLDAAETAYSEAIRLMPRHAAAFNNRGTVRHARKDWQGAIADYDRAIQIDPKYVDAQYNRSVARRCNGDWDGAIADCDAILSIDPRHANAYYSRAEARRNLGDLDGAIRDCDAAIQIDPRHAVAYNSRAVARYDRFDYRGAIADCNEALRMDPGYAKAYNTRAAARLPLDDRDGALADNQRAMQIDPFVAEFHGNCGAIRDGIKDFAGAIAECDRALELNPRLGWVYLLRGNSRYHLLDSEGMIADYRRAFELSPRLVPSLIVRKLIRNMGDDPSRALAASAEFLAHSPDDSMTLATRGLTLLLLGRRGEADTDLERFRELLPEGGPYLDTIITEIQRRSCSPPDRLPACSLVAGISVRPRVDTGERKHSVRVKSIPNGQSAPGRCLAPRAAEWGQRHGLVSRIPTGRAVRLPSDGAVALVGADASAAGQIVPIPSEETIPPDATAGRSEMIAAAPRGTNRRTSRPSS